MAALLSALAAPASLEELAGERAAVAGFVRSQQDPASMARPVGSRLRRPGRIVGVLAAGLVVAIGAGSAAVASGALPPGVQHGAQRLLSPFGISGPTATSLPRPATTIQAGLGWSATPRSGPSDPDGATTRQLCQAWASEQNDPHRGDQAGNALKDLLDRAGNPSSVPKFCSDLLGQGHDVDPSAAVSVGPSSSVGPNVSVGPSVSVGPNNGNDHGNPDPHSSGATQG